MSTEQTDPSPWGTHRPGRLFLFLVRVCRAVPQRPLVKQLAFLIRRLARAVVEDPVDVVQWGHRLRLRTRGNISESTFLFMPDRWDLPERRLLRRELTPGAVLVDVGANAGGYLWWVLHCLGHDCRIVAVEPDPRLHRRLRFNLESNGFDNVRVVGAAVGTEPGEGWLRLASANLGQNVLQRDPGDPRDGDATSIRVPVRSLPELVAEAGLARIDALKIDVEGLEAPILQDFFDRAPERLWPRILLMERQPGPEHRAIRTRLESFGYHEALSTRLNVVLRRSDPPG